MDQVWAGGCGGVVHTTDSVTTKRPRNTILKVLVTGMENGLIDDVEVGPPSYVQAR